METISITLRYTKTVKLDMELANDCSVLNTVLSGDFFTYPEEAIDRLEEKLRGCGDVTCVEEAFTALDNATILGFDKSDLAKKIKEIIRECRERKGI